MRTDSPTSRSGEEPTRCDATYDGSLCERSTGHSGPHCASSRVWESRTATRPDGGVDDCDYCCGIGACPKCWGRPAITALRLRLSEVEAERDRAREDATMAAEPFDPKVFDTGCRDKKRLAKRNRERARIRAEAELRVNPPGPTHCVKGHPAMWCTCERFVAAELGRFTDMPTIQYPPAPPGQEQNA